MNTKNEESFQLGALISTEQLWEPCKDGSVKDFEEDVRYSRVLLEFVQSYHTCNTLSYKNWI